MKKSANTIGLSLSILFATGIACGYEWHLESNATWSSSIGTADSDGLWYRMDGDNKIYIRSDADFANDKFIFGNTQTSQNAGLTIDVDNLELGALEIDSMSNWGNLTYVVGSKFGTKLTINGDLSKSVGDMIFMGNLDLHVKGDVSIFGNNISSQYDNSDTYRLIVDGNLTSVAGSPSFYFKMNGTVSERAAAGTDTFENGLSSPDLIVKGIVEKGNLFSMGDPKYDNYFQIGGVSGSATIRREGASGAPTTSYFILTNSDDYTTSGNSNELCRNAWSESLGKMTMVMNGTASQTFTSNTMYFHGGVVMLSGTLRINFTQSANNDQHFADLDANKKWVTYWTGRDGSGVRTVSSHGDLVMKGGTFASLEDGSGGYGDFRFTNIVYSGGTIRLRLDGENSCDTITLQGYCERVDDSTDAENIATSYVWHEGGTISLAEGAEGKVNFDFGNSLDWLIDAEGDGIRVVAWDEGNKTLLDASDFSANLYTNGDGSYMAQFAVADDGLYVKYVVVPEPATVALLFGFAALAFSAYRRKK